MIPSTVLLLVVLFLISIWIVDASNVVTISPNVQVDENSGVTINMFYVEGEGSLSLELKIKNREEQYYIIVSTEDGSVQLCDKLFSVANGDNVQCSYDKNILKHGDNQFLITIFSVDKKKIVLRTSAHFYYEGYVINGVEVQPSDFLDALDDNKELLIGGVLGGAAAYAGYRYWRQRSVQPPLPSVSDISKRLETYPQLPVVVEDPPVYPDEPLLLTSPPMIFQSPSPKTQQKSALTMPLILKVSGVAAAVALGMRAARTYEPLRTRPVETLTLTRGRHHNHPSVDSAFDALVEESQSNSLRQFRFSPVYDFPSFLFDKTNDKIRNVIRALRGVRRNNRMD